MIHRLPRMHVRVPLRPRRPAPRTVFIRKFAQQTERPVSTHVEDDLPYVNPQQSFARHTLFTLTYFRRLFRYSLIGLLAVAASTWTAFEGAHLWVENVEMAVEEDNDLKAYGWSDLLERWSGNPRGGTDPALGFKTRHAVRSAWMAQNWGTGSNVISSTTLQRTSTSNVNFRPVEAGLEFAHEYLNTALAAAQAVSVSSPTSLHPLTITALLSRRANALERVGSPDALLAARSDYERVYADSLSHREIDSARLALKLGDLCSRLGEADRAVEWWSKTLHLLYHHQTPSSDALTLVLPDKAPTSPLAQRTFASLLTSLSAHYAQSGYFKQARTVEELGIKLLDTAYTNLDVPVKAGASQPSAADSLHRLYLLHRKALLSTHLAEILHALRTDTSVSLSHLQKAAEASEHVALTLNGLPLIHPDAPRSKNVPHPPSPDAPLLEEYSKSRTLRTPATNLLRAARRSAAETWNLAGLLHESKAKSETSDENALALDCYERALAWASSGASASTTGRATEIEVMLEKDWKELWSNYVRVRDVVRHTAKP